MPSTYEPIATTTLGSAAASITFSSIAGTYTDLRLVLAGGFGTAGGGGNATIVRFNSDTGTNYSSTFLYGDGTTAASFRSTNVTSIGISLSNSTQVQMSTMDIFSYAGSTNKTALVEWSGDTNGSGQVRRNVGLWRNTAAITTILINNTDQFAIGTTATLYGIKNA
jgi:hypothetical protein